MRIKQTGSVLVISLIIAAVLIAGGVTAYFVTDGFGGNSDSREATNDNKTFDESAEIDDSTKKVPDEATGTDTMTLVKAAINGGDSIKCTAKYKDDDGKHHIVTEYIKDKDHIRLEIRSDMGLINTLMLKQKTSYTWLDGMKSGTKASMGGGDNKTAEEQWQEFSDDAKKDGDDGSNLSCKKASLSNPLFAIPKGVKFSTLPGKPQTN